MRIPYAVVRRTVRKIGTQLCDSVSHRVTCYQHYWRAYCSAFCTYRCFINSCVDFFFPACTSSAVKVDGMTSHGASGGPRVRTAPVRLRERSPEQIDTNYGWLSDTDVDRASSPYAGGGFNNLRWPATRNGWPKGQPFSFDELRSARWDHSRSQKDQWGALEHDEAANERGLTASVWPSLPLSHARLVPWRR
jgi:hypothetical protein